MDDSYNTSSCGSHIQNHRKKMTHKALLSLPWKMTLRSTLPRQRFGQEMGQVLSSSRACFVIILSKSVLSQIQTIPKHPVRENGQIAKLMIFSFPCFKGSHPLKTHYSIVMIPFHNSCQEPTNLRTPPFKQSELLRYLRSLCAAKFPSLSAWVYLTAGHSAHSICFKAFNQQICKRWPAL